jgi:hypothetical protein
VPALPAETEIMALQNSSILDKGIFAINSIAS